MRKTPKFVFLSLMIFLFLNTRHAFAKKLFNEISTSHVKYLDVDSYQTLLSIMSSL